MFAFRKSFQYEDSSSCQGSSGGVSVNCQASGSSSINPFIPFNSRSRWSPGDVSEWCQYNGHCSDPAIACGDLMEDVEAAQRLASEFPDKVRLVRYEDLSLDTLDTVKKILSFLNLPWHSSIQKYIASHTKSVPNPSSAPNPYTTVRNSTATVMSWVEKMSSSNVTRVQDSCLSPMKALGYKLLNSSIKASVQLEDILVTRDKWRLQ